MIMINNNWLAARSNSQAATMNAIYHSISSSRRFARTSLGVLLSVAISNGSAIAAPLADPAGSGVIVNAVSWLQGTLMGTVATVVAVIAIACVGFAMLTGRMNWRHGAIVVLGCFILFGAASIVAGIRAAAAG